MLMSELFHVLNRGVDKRKIYMDDADRARFVHDLWEFNDTLFVNNVGYRFAQRPKTSDPESPKTAEASKNMDFVNPYIAKERIVDLHGWCLMGNHYHLLLSERTEGGLTQFIRRLNVGYANYFNERYERSGALFQGRTKKVPIETDAHFLYILHYIHLNPLDHHASSKEWRSGSIKNTAKALGDLSKYRWSSYLDYCGKKNFPSVLTTDLFGDVFGNYKKRLGSYVRDMETEIFQAYRLE